MGVIQSSLEPGSLAAATPHTYQYDQQYRLTSDHAGSPLVGNTSTWQLDSATEITRTTYTTVGGFGSSPTTSTRTYDAANELKSLLETQGSTTTKDLSFTFNSRGERTQLYNKLSGVTTAYGYDAAERLTSSGAAANPTNYRYNGDGVRVSKSTGLSSNSYVWGAGQDLLQDNTASYIYGPGGMLVEAVQSSTPYYYHADQLGSVRAITNQSGAVSNTYTYDAYGNTTASTGTVANPFKYSGQYTDSETGFLYLRARYYDPATQQFLSVDPLLAQTEQAYAYVGGSPTNGVDPSGLWVRCISVGAWGGLAAGLSGTYYWCGAENGDTGILLSGGFQASTGAGVAGIGSFVWSDAKTLEELEGFSVNLGLGIVITGKNGLIGDIARASNGVTTCSIGLGVGPNIGMPFGEAHGGLSFTKIIKKSRGGVPPSADGLKRYFGVLGIYYDGDTPPAEPTPSYEVCGTECTNNPECPYGNCFGDPAP